MVYQFTGLDSLDLYKPGVGIKVVSGVHEGHFLATLMDTQFTGITKINSSMPFEVSISRT